MYYTRPREVLIAATEQMPHFNELQSNLYQRNCVDLKPVPIIRFTFEFEFRIVWNSEPSKFSILKCPSQHTRLF